jgi:hypothetical protein
MRAAIRIAIAGLGFLLACLPMLAGAQTSTVSLEQALAETYAPIVMIKTQPEKCSNDGEQFRPVMVDILFGTDDVRLMQRGSGAKTTDIEIKRNIAAADLAGLNDSYYLDLPGEPRNPECTYETWGNARMAELGLEPSIYARVTSEAGQDGIVVQYWFYWVFNFFNNTHESDWEGIQLTFDANSVQEILDQQLMPSAIAFAQHEGGEQADPDDDKVEWQGTHVVAHPSAGSHADYYESAVWLGWGENGSGFGCDYSDAPDEELPVDIVLIPDEIDPTGPFAWLTYEGLWGEREEPSMFAGPTGPNTKPRWDTPISWGQEIRGSSLPVPIKTTIGPSVSNVFCGAASLGSELVRAFPIDPKVISGIIVAYIAGFLILAAMAWRYFAKAVRVYLRYGYFFITTGVLALPLAIAGQRLEDFLQDSVFERVESHLPDSDLLRSVVENVIYAGLGSVQEIVLACIVGPAVIYATYELVKKDPIPLEKSWRRGLRLFPRVLGASFLVALVLTVMALTIVLLPLVIYKSVQWFYAPQAVVVDGASWRSARLVSAARIRGNWIRALAVGVAVAAISGLPGPLIGTALLVFDVVPLDGSQWISAAVYCVLYPVSIIMATLFYIQRSMASVKAEPNAALSSPDAGAVPSVSPA